MNGRTRSVGQVRGQLSSIIGRQRAAYDYSSLAATRLQRRRVMVTGRTDGRK